jgi:glutamate dehydrogenase
MDVREEILNKLSDEKLSGADLKLFKKFIKEFYKNTNPRDFFGYKDDDILHFALISFKAVQIKEKNSFKVNCLNDHKNITIFNIVNDDKPFLLDSIIIEFENRELAVKNIIHPILSISRDSENKIKNLSPFSSENNESIIQLHCEKIHDEDEINSIIIEIDKILETCDLVVADWPNMLKLAGEAKEHMLNCKNKIDNVNIDEFIDFIEWIENNNFIFLGITEYQLLSDDGNHSLVRVPEKTLGVLRSGHDSMIPNIYNRAIGEIAQSIEQPYFIEILKSKYTSRIHRYSYTERIRIQKFDKEGKVSGEYRLIGLFASSAYYQPSNHIPLVRNKIKNVIDRAGYAPRGHNAKDLKYVLDSYPRDELFQISEDDLCQIAMGIVNISGRSVIRFFPRIDKFSRFVSCLVFLPKDLFNTTSRQNIQDILEEEYGGYVDSYNTYFTMHQMVRLHIVVKTDDGIKDVDINEIEKVITEVTRIWSDDLKDNIFDYFDIKDATKIYKLYKKSFSLSYQNRFSGKNVVHDINSLENSRKYNKNLCSIYKSNLVNDNFLELKIYSAKSEFALSMIMPILESFYFNVISEHTYTITLSEEVFSIQYYKIAVPDDKFQLTDDLKDNIEDIINRILADTVQPSYSNKLVISSNLNWKQVYLINAYTKYLYQANLRYSQNYVSDILYQNSDFVKLLVSLFYNKFDPNLSSNRAKNVEKISDEIREKLSEVANINHDEVLKKFLNIIDSTIRTNFFQKKDYLSFKIDSGKVIDIALPKLFAEIFVFSGEMEAIHLRGGRVARGGLRWSDRLEDFRNEVLDLVKTQMTKNAQIIPVGSKGGFVIKSDLSNLTRDEVLKKAVECYKTFLRGMLDITDNVIDQDIIHPKDVVIYDSEDPYLVVAADKGTATFSDIANSVSKEYDFWLQDAFASGGSDGYDHKKMGITARGAWVSVVRHFMELDINIERQEFTVVGIGDMSGDVFGNGMLLSDNIRLQAAFNHLHIFIDPNPDSKISFKERERLFDLPRSSWTDYNKGLISKGGGVFSRSQKIIPLSKEMKKFLGIKDNSLTPDQLISSILKAKVDLLWNGGIGTYIKASDESNSEVSDKLTESVRVNASDLRCNIIGEGGNLGITQRGRIEFALMGKKINTDAIDNAGGVDCSDHEVNIKIALMSAIKSGKLSSEKRSKLLESMTEEVADLVLNNNRLQTQAITIEESLGCGQLDNQARLLNRLSQNNFLNRKIEFIPNFKEIQKRKLENRGLIRPELSVILSYVKMDLYNKIISSSLLDDPYFEKILMNYFPIKLRESFIDEIRSHRLRREIIATELVNSVINRLGLTFVNQLHEETNKDFSYIVSGFIAVRDIFDFKSIWLEIEKLSNVISCKSQSQLFDYINRVIYQMIFRFFKLNKDFSISDSIEKFAKVKNYLYEDLENILAEDSMQYYLTKKEEYLSQSISEKLSDQIASLDALSAIYDIVNIAGNCDVDYKDVAKTYFKIGTELHLKWLSDKVLQIPVNTHWDDISIKTIIDEISDYQSLITQKIISLNIKNNKQDISNIDNWLEENILNINKYEKFIAELKSNIVVDSSIAVVAINNIKNLML